MMEEKKSIRIAALFLHPQNPKDDMVQVKSMNLIAGKGILGNVRYWDKITKKGAKLKRHVSAISQESIKEHERQLEMKHPIQPGQVRSNIELVGGGNLSVLFGKRVQIGKTAIIECFEFRKPCNKMDKIQPGLFQSMKNNQQGVMAEIVVNGEIFGNDELCVIGDIH